MRANGHTNYGRDPAEAQAMADHFFRLWQEEGVTPIPDTFKPLFQSDHYLLHDEVAAMNPYDPELTINSQPRKTREELRAFQEELRKERYEAIKGEWMIWMLSHSPFALAAYYFFPQLQSFC
jgi:hypothetical protein